MKTWEKDAKKGKLLPADGELLWWARGAGWRRYKISGNSASGTYLPSDFCGCQLAGGRGKAGRKNQEISPAVEGNGKSEGGGDVLGSRKST